MCQLSCARKQVVVEHVIYFTSQHVHKAELGRGGSKKVVECLTDWPGSLGLRKEDICIHSFTRKYVILPFGKYPQVLNGHESVLKYCKGRP
jgi:hypothetical protein